MTFDSEQETLFFKSNLNIETWIGRNEVLEMEDAEMFGKDYSQLCFGLHTEPLDEVGSDFKSFDCDTLMNVGCEIKTTENNSKDAESKIVDEFLIGLKLKEIGTWSEQYYQILFVKNKYFLFLSGSSQEKNVLRVR